jgi:hypothetical protein
MERYTFFRDTVSAPNGAVRIDLYGNGRIFNVLVLHRDISLSRVPGWGEVYYEIEETPGRDIGV